jgi:DNA-binding transcriptional LysR family regulator
MGVEPNDLLLFARIVEAGSFSMAAQRLDLPKSTVSRRIALLEPAWANACCSGPRAS